MDCAQDAWRPYSRWNHLDHHIFDVLTPRLPTEYHCRRQSAITTTDSEPEPDVAVVRGLKRAYLTRHPGPADLPLVIEAADSSLERDRTHKLWIYANANIPIYWIVNLVDAQVEVYTDSTGPAPAPTYRTRQVHRPGDLVPFILDGHDLGPIPAQELLP
jgi:Uma2 family endonuclease